MHFSSLSIWMGYLRITFTGQAEWQTATSADQLTDLQDDNIEKGTEAKK
jgi:hypothetical protein